MKSRSAAAMMCRTLEVGRAVLSSPNTNQELWLTILITLSQQQQLIDFEQHSVDSLLQHLSAGDIWVNRGEGMNVELSLTHEKELLARQPLESLISSILSAPAWEQLNFRPWSISGPECEPGKVRLVLDRSTDDGLAPPRSLHRILSNVPATDMKPPKDIPCVSLNSVHIQMDIMDIKEHVRTASTKRSKTWAKKINLPTSQPQWINDKTARDLTVVAACDPATDAKAPPCENEGKNHLFEEEDAGLKRKRTLTSATVIPSEDHSTETSRNPAPFEILIDGALRLAICGSPSKSTNGLKIKANSIHASLAELIPELWSPGFSLAMSSRVQLLPIISCSLGGSVGARATSLSLKEKMAQLETISILPTFSHGACQASNPSLVAENVTSPIACRLWLHLRKNLHKVKVPSLSFVATDPQAMELSGSDHSILEHAGQDGECDEGLSSHEVGVYETSHVRVTPSDTEDDLLLDTDPQSIKYALP